MFQPETEDMLPREAPKPTSNVPIGQQDATVKPSVPELSIVFGQDPGQAIQQQQQQKSAPQTYADWKKQMLPKVTFAANGENQRSNVYPFRTAPISSTATISPLATPNGTELVNTAAVNAQKEMPYMRRSLETLTPSLVVPVTGSYTPPLPLNSTAAATNAAIQQLYITTQQRRSLESIVSPRLPPTTSAMPVVLTQKRDDVLTICAGTQTDVTSPTKLQTNYATKDDMEQLFNMFQELREQQMRGIQLCEALLLQQHEQNNTKTCVQKEVEIQCDLLTGNPQQVRNPKQIVYDYGDEAAANPLLKQQQLAKIYQASSSAQFQTPQAIPAAQSTAYRANTPRAQPLYQPQQENVAPRATVLPKAASEQSLVMKELALKYLPNEKLTELLEDLKLNNNQAEPLRNIENLDKCTTDMSNASYRYLKKYRLLPEDASPIQQTDAYQISDAITSRARSPQLQHSPYQRTASPVMAEYSPRQQNQNHLDLEHIKNKPKFL